MRGSLKRKIIITNAIVVFIVISLLYGLFYYYSVSNYKKSIKDFNTQLIQQAAHIIDEKVVEEILKIPYLYFSNNNYNQALVKPIEEKIDNTVDIVSVHDKIDEIISKNDFVDSLDIFYEYNQLLFISGAMKKLDDPAVKWSKLPDWYDDKKFLEEGMKSYITPARYDEASGNTLVTYVINIMQTSPYKTTIAIHIPSEKVLSLVDELSLIDHEEILYILDKDGRIIVKSVNVEDNDLDNLVIEEAHDYIDRRVIQPQLRNFNSVDYMLTTVPSQYNELIYIYGVPVQGFYDLSTYIYILIVILIVSGVISFILSIFVNMRAYQPIGKILNIVKEIPMEEELTYDNEYEFVKDKLVTIADEQVYLREQLENNRPAIYHSTLYGIVTGTQSIRDNSWKEYLQINFNYNKIFCMIIKLKREEEKREDLALAYKWIDAFRELDDDYTIYSIVDNDQLISIVNTSNDMNCQVIIQRVKTVLQMDVKENEYRIASGKSFRLEEGKIPESYRTAKDMLLYFYLWPNENHLSFDIVESKPMKKTGSSHLVMKRMEEFVKGENYESLSMAINGLLESLRFGQYTIKYCMNTIRDLSSTIRYSFVRKGIDVDDVLEYDLREIHTKVDDITNYQIIMNDVIHLMIEKVQEKKEKDSEHLLMDIKYFINENIYNDLSLELLADYLNIRYDTLSKRFKDLAGMTFTNYVKEVKLEKAEELILTKNYTVYEISSKLGYNSTHYFIRIFKQKYGLTPKQYQTNHMER